MSPGLHRCADAEAEVRIDRHQAASWSCRHPPGPPATTDPRPQAAPGRAGGAAGAFSAARKREETSAYAAEDPRLPLLYG